MGLNEPGAERPAFEVHHLGGVTEQTRHFSTTPNGGNQAIRHGDGLGPGFCGSMVMMFAFVMIRSACAMRAVKSAPGKDASRAPHLDDHSTVNNAAYGLHSPRPVARYGGQMLETAMFVVNLLVLVLAVWALIDCAFRPAAAFPAIERQTKMAWLAFLAIATVVIYFFGGISLIGMIGVVVSVYYLVDVRSKVLELTRR